MTSLIPLQKPIYPQSFMLIYGFLLELWVSNLNKKKKKKMKNSTHHSPITKHSSALYTSGKNHFYKMNGDVGMAGL